MFPSGGIGQTVLGRDVRLVRAIIIRLPIYFLHGLILTGKRGTPSRDLYPSICEVPMSYSALRNLGDLYLLFVLIAESLLKISPFLCNIPPMPRFKWYRGGLYTETNSK
jgi:hypothetical protein